MTIPRYALGNTSRKNLIGVHPDLIRVAERAIQISSVDFQVYEGCRSRARQTKLVATGASQTMNSRHIPSEEGGYGHAVDLVPMIDFNGDGRLELRWDWSLCYKVAAAVRRASVELGVEVRWGGVWDRRLGSLTAEDLEDEVTDYTLRRKAMGRKAFLDGPHFELPEELYP